jgi:hypothetical protein
MVCSESSVAVLLRLATLAADDRRARAGSRHSISRSVQPDAWWELGDREPAL